MRFETTPQVEPQNFGMDEWRLTDEEAELLKEEIAEQIEAGNVRKLP